jgi:glycerophosphoryl diester phosphodiesterase
MGLPKSVPPSLVRFEAWPYPKRCAHRGAGKLAPENTLAAFRHGASFGYKMFEFDAKLSGDGVAMLMHDPTLERTTNGVGRVAGKTFGELAQLDAGSWHSAGFAGESIPSLEKIARWMNANQCLANIEIKPCPGREAETGAAIALEARRLFAGQSIPPLLSSFSEIALDAAREAAPELPRGLLVTKLPSDWVARCKRLGCVAIDPHFSELSREVIALAHAEGLRVASYTVNDVELAERLSGWGLDVLITDMVDRIKP